MSPRWRSGIARAAFEFAVDYSKERVQFGVPIAIHQGIQFLIADMATKIHVARLATWNSAVLLDQGRRNTLESSHAKRFAADTAMEVTTDAVQVYGGYGFIKDYPVEKLMRDAKIMQLYEGTSQIQRLVIARETLLPRHVEAFARRSRMRPPAGGAPGAQLASERAVILGGVRTPVGRYGGSLSHIRTDDLLGQTMVAACERVGVPLDRIEDIAAGCVNPAHEGMGDIARWAALAAGFPDSVPAATVNRFCASSLTAPIHDRARDPQRASSASASPAGSSRCRARAGR